MSNKIVQALEDGAGKLAKTLGEDAGKAVKNLYQDTGSRLKRVASNHSENDVHHAEEMERLAKRPRAEEKPVYHLDDDGQIKRLRHDPDATDPDKRYRKEDLTDEDKQRIGLRDSSIGAPTAGERTARLKNKSEGFKPPRPSTKSTPVGEGSTDLAKATKLAHHADNYYPNTASSRNYAAVHVKGAGGHGDFILVGRSHPGGEGLTGAHSERMVGTPFLRQGEGNRITHLYTERAPCSNRVNCSAWMAERLGHVQVSHTFEYGSTAESQKAGNDAVKNYLKNLKASR